MSSNSPSLLGKIIYKIIEGLVTYIFIGMVMAIIMVSVQVGHFPTKREMTEQIQRIRDFVNKTTEVAEGVATINTQLTSLGPQLQEISKKLTEIEQRVANAEIEINKLKAEKK